MARASSSNHTAVEVESKPEGKASKAQQAAVAQPPAISKEKAKALDMAVGQIEKTFGKGSIMKLDEHAYANIPGISTGAISLDLALGGKGIPRGRIVEIFGPEFPVRPRSP